ncbi:polyhydroxyalkanoate biosynthesis repressor PhaR [Neobacillus pocheonensis]|uniref:Polyhydroxyalkanoate biosynthesis repressor PhaR n=1 Tax=Neobacillus pocheonensis TaxID=363869 RepID=A0ABT0WDA5_9BACI|nr:polyhydroxyalkanoate biosynthesis repressor PhaR [Neobacillus pocheonensis]
MTNQKPFEPFDLFNKFSGQWEKQVNEVIHLWTNNREFVRLSRHTTDSHVRYKEMFNKSQELLTNQLNLPTKEDVANIAQLSIQSEEKIDSLEEQIWKLQDSVTSTNKEIEGIGEVSNDIIKLTKQLKTELTKTKGELSETKKLHSELLNLKNELADLRSIKEEVAILLDFIGKKNLETSDVQERELSLEDSK